MEKGIFSTVRNTCQGCGKGSFIGRPSVVLLAERMFLLYFRVLAPLFLITIAQLGTMEKIVEELHKIFRLKDSTDAGDIVIIVTENPQTLS